MHISAFQLNNYKSYFCSETIKLSRGFNIFIGKNNAGKTALLEALTLRFKADRHRSQKTLPRPNSQNTAQCYADVSFAVSGSEVSQVLSASGQTFELLLPDRRIPELPQYRDQNPDSIAALVRWILAKDAITLSGRYPADGGWSQQLPSHDLYSAPQTLVFARFRVVRDVIEVEPSITSGTPTDFGTWVIARFLPSIYYFDAQRFNIGRSSVGNNRILDSNARNLPEVLAMLQANPARFHRFNTLVRTILPDVHHVSVQTEGSGPGAVSKILVWNEDPANEREDLAMPLNECGTGIGQVLAILYVVTTSEVPRTIIVDEPQSFLHPGAIRKLIDILKNYPQHQFIVATHSPLVLSACGPSTITLLAREHGESKLRTVNVEESQSVMDCLLEVGARLSDLFGADNVLWVEGATEEKCFPMIVRDLLKRDLAGTIIRGLLNTGDLEGTKAELIFEIYKKISQADSLLPPAIGFILDRETRSGQEREELQRKGKGKVRFTGRRMYENYLLNATAIAAIANGIKDFRPDPVTVQEVSAILATKSADREYFKPSPVPAEPGKWRSEVDGAKILKDAFRMLSGTRVSYDKVTHGSRLTDWLIKNAPEDLSELVELLRLALDRGDASPLSSRPPSP